MPPTLTLREQRRVAIVAARAVVDEAGDRVLDAEEQQTWDRAMGEAEEVRGRIDTEERTAAAEADLGESRGRTADPPDGSDPPSSRGSDPPPEAETRAIRRNFHQWLGGLGAQNPIDFRGEIVYGDDGSPEVRALQADVDTAGGYTVIPQQFVAELIADIDNEVFMREISRKFTVARAESLGVPTRETDIEDASWTSEIGTVDEDTALAYGKRELRPYPLAKRIKVSNKLFRASALNMEQEVRQRMAYKHAVPMENAYLNGDGAEQPLGVFVASDDGISTGRDVSTGNEATYPTFDGLKSAKYTLKKAYRRNARWIMHRDVVATVAKLKDGEGRYIWIDSVVGNDPDRLLNFDVLDSEYAPNTLTTGQYVAILGDFNYYWIADGLDFQMQRLVELYAENNQIGFIGRMESDGMPILENAFVRVKLG